MTSRTKFAGSGSCSSSDTVSDVLAEVVEGSRATKASAALCQIALSMCLTDVADERRARSLVERLLDGQLFEKCWAYRSIGLRRDVTLKPLLMQGLHSGEPSDRGHAALALARLETQVDLDALRTAFRALPQGGQPIAEMVRVPREDNTLEYRLAVKAPIPSLIPAILGDLIHNLRASLDYVACELVRRNGSAITKQTSFPIADTLEKLEKLVEKSLEGASPTSQDAVRQLCLRKGVRPEALWMLHALDIRDKHRLLLTALMSADAFTLLFKTKGLRSDYDSTTMPEWTPMQFQPASSERCMEDGSVLFSAKNVGHLEHKTFLQIGIAVDEPDILRCVPILRVPGFLAKEVQAALIELSDLLF